MTVFWVQTWAELKTQIKNNEWKVHDVLKQGKTIKAC